MGIIVDDNYLPSKKQRHMMTDDISPIQASLKVSNSKEEISEIDRFGNLNKRKNDGEDFYLKIKEKVKFEENNFKNEKNNFLNENSNSFDDNIQSISNYNLNQQPSKGNTKSLIDNKEQNIEFKKNINKTLNSSFSKDVSNKTISTLPPKDFSYNDFTTDDNLLLSNSINNNNSLAKGKFFIPSKDDFYILESSQSSSLNDTQTNEMLIEQLQREEVLLNSLSDNPFIPPISESSNKTNSSLDKVQLLILEQERLLQEYNRKRKGKEKAEDKKLIREMTRPCEREVLVKSRDLNHNNPLATNEAANYQKAREKLLPKYMMK